MHPTPEQPWLVAQDELPSTALYSPSEPTVTGLAWQPLLDSLRRHALTIVSAACVMALVAFMVCSRLTPLYESTTTLEINAERNTDLLGPDAARTAWSDADQFIATQLHIIQEDSVLRPVVERNHLPVADDVRDAKAPILLKGLKVVRPPNTYLIQVSYRAPDPVLAADVSNEIADSYLRHIFHARLDDRKSQTSFMEQQLDEVHVSMERSAKAVSEFESRLGVVDPQDKTSIISARLLQLSTEYTTAQADRIKKESDYIGLKNGSLPAAQQSDQGENLKQLETSLEQAQQKFVEIREHFGVKHPEFEKQAAIIAGLQGQIQVATAMVVQRALVAYTDAKDRESILERELATEKASFDKLNSTSYQYQSLKIEAEGNRKLYDDLERRIKESAINGSFQNSSIHVSDLGRPAAKPIFPRTGLTVALAFCITLVLGTGIAVGLELSDETIRTPAQIESSFHVDVIGAIPQCNLAEQGAPLLMDSESAQAPAARSTDAIQSPSLANKRKLAQRRLYDEAVRMLWSSFQLASTERGIRSLLVTSAAPGEGKTTLATGLALVHATHGRRTLLIDADLRRPSAHRLAQVGLCPGLAEVARDEVGWQDTVVPSRLHPHLNVLPAGVVSTNSCDTIAQMMPRILAEAGAEYDLVLVDGPPLLAFADPMHLASVVDGVLVVVCAEKTDRRTVALMLQTLRRVRAHLVGVALNRMPAALHGNSYAYRYYTEDAHAA